MARPSYDEKLAAKGAGSGWRDPFKSAAIELHKISDRPVGNSIYTLIANI